MVNRFGRPKKRRLSKPDNDLPGYVNAAVSLNRYQVVALKLSLNTSLLLMCATRQVSYIRCRTCINVTTVTTTWTHIKSSPSIVITGSAILSIRCHVTENHVTMHHPEAGLAAPIHIRPRSAPVKLDAPPPSRSAPHKLDLQPQYGIRPTIAHRPNPHSPPIRPS